MSSESEYLLVAAIDFGTTFSGYAFSFKTTKDQIRMCKDWEAEGGLSGFKTPTCVLVDPHGEFVAFGFDAESQYAELAAEEAAEYCFFDRFKMQLYDTQNLSESTTIQARNSRQRPAIDVYAMAMKCMKERLLETVQKQLTDSIDPEYIRWVVTVPAIWSDAAKQFMRRAAFKAGITTEVDSTKLLIALEPEAASLYCRTLDIEQVVETEGQPKTGLMPPGTKYIVLDAGGGTLDVTAHELLEGNRVKELYQASGGYLGGTKVDKNFEELLKKVLDERVLDQFREKCGPDWLETMKDFERKKRNFDRPRMRRSSTTTNIHLLGDLGEIYEEVHQKSLKDSFPKSDDCEVCYRSGTMCFGNEVVMKLFTPVVEGIVEHIRNLLEIKELSEVTHLLMVGGFSECHVLQEAVKQEFGERLKIVIPNEAGLCVIRGAVMFGHEPEAITSRVARKTYGTEVSKKFKAGEHDELRKEVVEGVEVCSGMFKTLIKKGESVEAGSIKVFHLKPSKSRMNVMTIEIFSSDEEDPKYIDKETMPRHGVVEIALSGFGKSRKIPVEVMFGGTEIRVRAQDPSSTEQGHCAATTIQFLSN